jgi:hypothetical protein
MRLMSSAVVRWTLSIVTEWSRSLRHSQFSKFPAFSLFVFCAATNKSDFRPILWILHLALHVATPLCVLSVARYWVYSADDV